MLNDFDLLFSVFLAQELNWRLLWLLCVKPCVAAKQILSGEKGWEHEVFLPCLHTSLTPCLQWMTIANVVIFSPSHQMFPCMCRDTIRFGFWRWGEHLQPHLNSNCSSSKWVKNVMTSKVQWIVVWGETPFSTGDRSQFCRIYYITKECWAWQTACLVLPRYCKAWKHSVKILKTINVTSNISEQRKMHAVWRSRTNMKCEPRRDPVENAVQMEVAKWRKGEKQLHSRT